jgi:hypothetical protein
MKWAPAGSRSCRGFLIFRRLAFFLIGISLRSLRLCGKNSFFTAKTQRAQRDAIGNN